MYIVLKIKIYFKIKTLKEPARISHLFKWTSYHGNDHGSWLYIYLCNQCLSPLKDCKFDSHRWPAVFN